ncbi:anti-sigma factor [Synechocystis sp. PCC 7509]|uniref:anti-sigma factor n=1 Tax=Synechocystis sp. PCC 7509 TaxID=927677 RepID=UPI00048F7A16|nr:anti-sigma factor [Synechocystis sp. PCC 7509]
MLSEQLQLLVAGYVLGDLSSEEAEEFEQLLATNSAIAQEVAQMQQVLEISYAPPEVSPPSHLRLAIMEAHQAIPRNSPRPVTKLARPFLSVWTIGAAAAVLIVALGISNYHLWRSLQVIQAQSRQDEFLTSYSLRAKNASLSLATVAVNPNKLEATLNVENLPPLPPGKVYVLWTVLKPGAPFTTDKKNAILTEVFKVDAQGNISKQITVPKAYRTEDVVTAMAVTMEDAVAPAKHAGAPILIVRL